jgi:hypothetical protein
VLSGYGRIFDENNPVTLAMLVNSASVLRALGDLRGAHDRTRHAMNELRDVLGDDHPYTLCAHHNHAIDLALLGNEGHALDEFRTVRELSSRVRDASHPDHIACEINLALTRNAIAGPDVGRVALAEAVARLGNSLGADHPLVAAAAGGRWLECDIEPPAT